MCGHNCSVIINCNRMYSDRFTGQKIPEVRIICGGVGALIGIQTFINISSGDSGIFPNTGISASVCQLWTDIPGKSAFLQESGLVLNVGLQPKKYQIEET